jgi:Ca2+-transporting ATPase
MKYVRVQMIMLAGFILTFVGAGIWTIVGGTPITPLQILWINFAVDVPLAFGLGFDAPTPGLMKRHPRASDAPVIARPMAVRLGITGVLIAVATLIVVSWAEPRYDDIRVATTMGFITLSMLHIVAAFEWRDPTRSVFHGESIANGRFNLMILISFGLAILGTSVGVFQRMLDTVQLSGDQWRACLIAVGGFLVFAEIEKVIARAIAPDKPKPLVQAAVA